MKHSQRTFFVCSVTCAFVCLRTVGVADAMHEAGMRFLKTYKAISREHMRLGQESMECVSCLLNKLMTFII